MTKILRGVLLSTLTIGVLFSDPKELLEEARQLVIKGMHEQAVDVLKTALSQNPRKNTRFEILTELAELELTLVYPPMTEDAFNHLMEAKSLFPQNFRGMDRVFYLLGVTYMQMGRYVDAAKSFETVATKFRKSKYFDDALNGVEEAFKKNFKEVEVWVEGEPITKIEVDETIEQIPSLFRKKYETPEGRKELIENMVNGLLSVKEAKSRKLYLRAKVIKEIKSAIDQILQRALQQEVTQSIKIPEREIEKFYYENRDKMYKLPARVTIRRIVVDTREEAEEIKKLLNQGVPMDSLAKARSVAPDAKNGGLLKNLTKESRPKEIVQLAFKMNEGQLSDIVEVNGKFTIFKLESKDPEKYRDFESVKTSIQSRLKNQKSKEEWQRFVDNLRKKYEVIYPEEMESKVK